MTQWMEPEIPHPGLLAQPLHQLLAVAIWPFDELAMLTTPIPVPEHPWFVWITLLVPELQHGVKRLRHRDLSRRQMATLLFSGVQDDIAVVQIDIFPSTEAQWGHRGNNQLRAVAESQ